jgi:hypothetical protein
MGVRERVDVLWSVVEVHTGSDHFYIWISRPDGQTSVSPSEERSATGVVLGQLYPFILFIFTLLIYSAHTFNYSLSYVFDTIRTITPL